MRVSNAAADAEEMNKLYASHKLIVQLAVQQWSEKQKGAGEK